METIPGAGGSCSVCGEPLRGDGGCLACLLRAGFEETVAEEAPLPPVFGDFEIARREDGSLWELGRGAMGVTYRAVDRVLHRTVALKVIDVPVWAGGAKAVRERFLREARAAAALKHANIAGVFQFGALPGARRCYYAMELVEGETIEARIRRDGPLSVETVLEIAVQVTAALMEAALRGLVHRDLKPGNLMLAGGGAASARLEVKVIDFGLAKAIATTSREMDLTRGGFIGTPAFASPEQFARGAVDARSDIYSLGVTLWYALAGRAPFTGKTIEELRNDPARVALPVEQLTARKVPAPMIALLRSTLAVYPAQRPASARELMAALERCRHRLGYGGRRTAGVWIASTALAVAALAAGVTWWLLARPGPDRRTGPAPFPEKSIAVLPFANLSADKENAFFTDGVQDEILTDLAKVADLKVISRTSVMPYKSGITRKLREIGGELGVAHVVEGSVQREGNRVRVSAQLIDARTDTHEWADHYDRDIADVFAIQSEIAQAIVAQLQAKLSSGEKAAIDTPPTTNLAAYNSYLQGRKLGRDAELTKEEAEMRQAVRQLEEATDRDPQFFLARCELCQADLRLYWFDFDHTPERLARAEAAAQAARRLRPDAGETHLIEGIRLYWGHRDFAAALTQFQAAERLLPNSSEAPYWLGLVERREGSWGESIAQLERATTLDPRNPELWILLGETDEMLYHYKDAARAYDNALAIDPQNLEYARQKAECARSESADLEPTRRWMRSVPPDSDEWRDTATLTAVFLAVDDRDYPAAARALARYPLPTITDRGFVWPRAEFEGQIALLAGDKAAAQVAFLAARRSAEEIAAQPPDAAKALMVLACIDSELDREEDAIREGQQACAMLPVAKDAFDGPYLLRQMARIYARAGERDQAIGTLRAIIANPSELSYGDLRLDREWDPLRGDPRFEPLVASLAPKPGR